MSDTAPMWKDAPESLALMDGMARQFEEEFESLERRSQCDRYAEKLESFLLRLHESADRFESLSDGSRLVIFWDGTVYAEESEFGRLLDRARRRTGKLILRRKAELQKRTPRLRRRGHK